MSVDSNGLAVRQADRHIRSETILKRLQKTARLDTLPYDVILLITQLLEARDVEALSECCKYLHDTVMTRPVFNSLAIASLRRCRPLPLSGFQRIRDLPTDQLIRAVLKAASLEDAWYKRGPRPSPKLYHAAFPDLATNGYWYRVLNVPTDDALEWLSPLTTAYNVFMTNNGKVVCWDQQRDKAVAEWQYEDPALLWKCRLAYESRTTYFAIMKLPKGEENSQEKGSVTRFNLIKLQSPPPDIDEPPKFAHVADFQMTGRPFNLFLLDPSVYLLGGFVWLSSSNNIALYVLHDWEKGIYSYIDTGIKWSNDATWSCYLHEQQVVVHTETEGRATEYLYPLSFLRQYARSGTPTKDIIPVLTYGVESPTKRVVELTPWRYQGPEWFPDSVHYVRQWWPALPGIPSLCNAVTLLVAETNDHGPVRYILTQHYFEAGLTSYAQGKIEKADGTNGEEANVSPADSPKLAMHYLSEDEDDDSNDVPLIATDFGHAVWIEDLVSTELDSDDEDGERAYFSYGKRIRFVNFPPVSSMWTPANSPEESTELKVYTLEYPIEVNLNEVNNICLDQSQGTVTLSEPYLLNTNIRTARLIPPAFPAVIIAVVENLYLYYTHGTVWITT
ncbi:hypothetical protein NM688_g8404 [Phlebia brevispora]|uniref:Uncharacterized protein n=1 Tax=Phlebia brevispora TaxID=194682 RepID=A0ACC1RTI4_9APHY|nr:hypothetical protein NM688_g8404 [Phlebia brevispora]